MLVHIGQLCGRCFSSVSILVREPKSWAGEYSLREQVPGKRESIIRKISGYSVFFLFPSTQVLTLEVKRQARAGSGHEQVM